MTVHAAGGVVLRDGPEVLLVHRPRYDDWTLPKGKRDPGEADEDCALREVEEETGMRCALGPETLGTRYLDERGRDKVVRYWVMELVEDLGFESGDEVDERRWVPVPDALGLLTHAHDRDVLLAASGLRATERP